MFYKLYHNRYFLLISIELSWNGFPNVHAFALKNLQNKKIKASVSLLMIGEVCATGHSRKEPVAQSWHVPIVYASKPSRPVRGYIFDC